MTKSATSSTAAAAAPMIDLAQALGVTLDAARLANPFTASFDGRSFAILPDGQRLHEIPDDTRLAPYAKGSVIVDDRDSLIRYVNRFSSPGTILLADYDALGIHARLDYHPDNQANDKLRGSQGACRHTATLKLRPSEEFARWSDFEGKLHPQDEFARFLEENATDVGHPEAATMVELSRDFEATVGQVYKSSTRLDNGDRKMIFESETKALDGVVIPQQFTLHIPLYQGEEPDALTALFRWRAAGDGSVRLGFQWKRVEYQRQAHFASIAHAVAEATGCPVMLGRATN